MLKMQVFLTAVSSILAVVLFYYTTLQTYGGPGVAWPYWSQGRQGLNQLQFKLWYCVFCLVVTVSIAPEGRVSQRCLWNNG